MDTALCQLVEKFNIILLWVPILWFFEVEQDLATCKFHSLINSPAFWKLEETSDLGRGILSLPPNTKYLEYIIREIQTTMFVICQYLLLDFSYDFTVRLCFQAEIVCIPFFFFHCNSYDPGIHPMF